MRKLVRVSLLNILFTLFLASVLIMAAGYYEFILGTLVDKKLFCYFSVAVIAILFKPTERQFVALYMLPIIMFVESPPLVLGLVVVYSVFFGAKESRVPQFASVLMIYNIVVQIFFKEYDVFFLSWISYIVFIWMMLLDVKRSESSLTFYEILLYFSIFFDLSIRLDSSIVNIFVLLFLVFFGIYLSYTNKILIYWFSKLIIIFGLLTGLYSLVSVVPILIFIELVERNQAQGGIGQFDNKYIGWIKARYTQILIFTFTVLILGLAGVAHSNAYAVILASIFSFIILARILQINLKGRTVDSLSLVILAILLLGGVLRIL